MENLVLSSSTLIGTDVKNTLGENLGNVKDVMIDFNSGRVAYLVLSFGGFMGMGNKYFAVPLEAIQMDSMDEKIILNINKERLENAPGFDKSNWPEYPTQEFIDEVYNFYGYGSYMSKVTEFADNYQESNTIKNNEIRNAVSTEWDKDRSGKDENRNIIRESFHKDVPDESTRNRNFDPDMTKGF